MNSIDYKQKYLKYKNKYIELKVQEQKIQSGGHMYSSGEYLFFIPEKTSNFDANEAYVKNGAIQSLDKLTNYLGNCSKFLRIGSTVNNKTIYTNQSSGDVLKRETKDISIAAYNVAINESKKVLDATQAIANIASQGYNAAKDALTKKHEISDTLHSSDLKMTTDEEKVQKSEQVKPEQVKPEQVKPEQVGGDTDCDKLPIPLPTNLKGFSFDNEINETSLVDYVKLINEKQGSEKISRVIVVQKKTNSFGFGGETRLKYNFVVSYNGDKIVVVRK